MWAKVTSYPYFPGVVVDPVADPSIVPDAVMALQEEENKTARAWLVRFHDKQGSWGWMHAERLEALGENEGESARRRPLRLSSVPPGDLSDHRH